MTYYVVIPSLRRPDVLHETVLSVLKQTIVPHRIILAVTSDEDVLPETKSLSSCEILVCPPGLVAQLNYAIDRLPGDVEFITILDDDVELADTYCESALELFRKNAEVVLFDGHVLQDGGVSREQAKILVQPQPYTPAFHEKNESYGCNMNIRRSLFDAVRFDDRLVAGALMHDLDFARRAKQVGVVGRFFGCRLVHLMVQSSRPSGLRYGYSQIMNPVYFYQKGLLSLRELLIFHLGRYLIRNILGLVAPGNIDRIGRVRGNMKALHKLLRGECEPEGILRF